MKKTLVLIFMSMLFLFACNKDQETQNQVQTVSPTEAASPVGSRSVPDAIATINSLITTVNNYITTGQIPSGPGTSILAQLNNILTKLHSSQPIPAEAQINGLISHLGGLCTAGTVDCVITGIIINTLNGAKCDISPVDNDGDTFFCDVDCDDSDPSVTTITWYLDADSDNYYTGSGITQCASPGSGYRSTGLAGAGDCNDSDANIHPGATEACGDGIDNDCDSFTDEDCGDPNLIEQSSEADLILHHVNSPGLGRLGQTFTMGGLDKNLTSVEVKLCWPGNGGLLAIDLYELVGGQLNFVASSNGPSSYFLGPFNTQLGQVNTRTFTNPPLLEAGKTYAFVMRNGGLNFYTVKGSNDMTSYPGGTTFRATTGNGTNNIGDVTYSPVNFDMWFRVNLQ